MKKIKRCGWLRHYYSELKCRFDVWWFWYSPPWSDWKRCGCCAGLGEEYHSFGGDVDIVECSCCGGLGSVKKNDYVA